MAPKHITMEFITYRKQLPEHHAMKIISGSSNVQLASSIARHLELDLVEVEIGRFANGEKRVWIKEEIKGHNIILVQSFSEPTDEHIVEFLLLADALERSGARHVNLVIPWMGYSLQDKVFRDGEPIAAKVIANLVSNAYVKRAFLLDLHNSSTPGFFSLPTQHLSAMPIFLDYAKKTFEMANTVVASPDFGGLKRARTFAERLGVELTNIDKHRNLHTGEVKAMGLHGDVEGKIVLIFDDLINSGSTVVSAAQILKDNGAKEVHFFASHGIFANNGHQRVENSLIDSVVVTNSIAQDSTQKLKVLDIGQTFADALSAWFQK
jgi:ribose-phosphate pyrophosphokinase